MAPGLKIHRASATPETISVAISNRLNETGRRADPIRNSQVWVKLGTMRPPISMMSPISAATPTRLAALAVPVLSTSA